MDLIRRLAWLLPLLENDGGAGGAAADPAEAAAAAAGGGQGEPAAAEPPKSETPAKSEPAERPKWLSQAAPEYQGAKELYGYKSLNDAAKELANIEKLRGSNRLVVLPGEDSSPEDVEAFRKAMNLVTDPAEYELPADGKVLAKEFVDHYGKEVALKLGLTKEQAKGVYSFVEDLVKRGTEAQTKQAEEAHAAQAKAEAELPAKIAEALDGNTEKAEGVMNLAKKYIIRFSSEGVLDKLQASGLLVDPAFMMQVAAMERKLGDPQLIETEGPDGGRSGAGKQGTKGKFGPDGYSKAWDESVGAGAQGA